METKNSDNEGKQTKWFKTYTTLHQFIVTFFGMIQMVKLSF